MARSMLLITFALLCLSVAFAEDDKPENSTTTATEKEDTGKTPGAIVSNTSTWDTLLSGGKNWSLLLGTLGSLLALSGLGLAAYYFYFLDRNKNNIQTYSGYNPVVTGYNPYTGYGQQLGRAMPGGSFSFARVLDLIAMAQETYEKFDFQSLDCQKKALCELQQKQNEFGDTGRKISSTFSYMDVLEGLPMPRVIQAYLKEYKDAVIQGKNSSKDCAAVYPKCDFSIKEVFVKYSKKIQKDER